MNAKVLRSSDVGPPPACSALLLDLCSISSASGDLPGITVLAERLASELSACDLRADLRWEQASPA